MPEFPFTQFYISFSVVVEDFLMVRSGWLKFGGEVYVVLFQPRISVRTISFPVYSMRRQLTIFRRLQGMSLKLRKFDTQFKVIITRIVRHGVATDPKLVGDKH